MVLTPSKMLPLGSKMPEFKLPDTASQSFQIFDASKITDQLIVVGFICNHCPYVLHIIESLSNTLNGFQAQGVVSIVISSNDVQSYPQDGPDKMAEFAQRHGFEFPYLYDETQSVAQSFQAECTPEFYVFNQQKTLIYRGQFDSSRPASQQPVSGEDLKEAVALGLVGKQLEDQKPSIGCNIKWK